MEVRKEGRKKKREEGRKEGRKTGRMEGWRKGRKYYFYEEQVVRHTKVSQTLSTLPHSVLAHKLSLLDVPCRMLSAKRPFREVRGSEVYKRTLR